MASEPPFPIREQPCTCGPNRWWHDRSLVPCYDPATDEPDEERENAREYADEQRLGNFYGRNVL